MKRRSDERGWNLNDRPVCFFRRSIVLGNFVTVKVNCVDFQLHVTSCKVSGRVQKGSACLCLSNRVACMQQYEEAVKFALTGWLATLNIEVVCIFGLH